VDLFLILKRGASKKEVETANDKLRSLCPRLYGNNMQIVMMTGAEYKSKQNTLLIKQVKRGLRLCPGS
jgi:hypothetical protein